MPPTYVTRILLKIGYVFLHVQATEKAVKLVMQIAMPCEQDLFASLTERLVAKERQRPLGPFLHELRSRATLHVDIDELLSRFLLNRNRFVHNILKVEGWSLKTEAGCGAASRFLNELLADSMEVRNIFIGLLHSWKVQSGLDTTEEEDRAFVEMEKYEGPILSRKWGKGA